MPYDIEIYDVLGRMVRTLTGTASGRPEFARWDLSDESNQIVQPGVYFYQFKSITTNIGGKLVVR